MTATNNGLEPIDPSTARELFLDHKRTDCREATVRRYRHQMKRLVEWTEENDLENLNDLTGRQLHEYRLWLVESRDINTVTLRGYMSGLRVFLKWAKSIDGVDPNLYEKVLIPSVDREKRNRDDMLSAEAAQELLTYLGKYHFASREHILIALLWETGIRLGAAISLDVEDVHLEKEYLQLVHRLDQGTPLKNGKSGERPVATSPELATLLADYLDNVREEVTDEYGRRPLFVSEVGRLTTSSIRRMVYKITSPCFRGAQCQGCLGVNGKKCPDGVCPHAIRRGSITHFLTRDVPVDVVSERMNVSRKVLEQHYDNRSAAVKLEQRRGYLSNI